MNAAMGELERTRPVWFGPVVESLKNVPVIAVACRAAGITQQALYAHCAKYPEDRPLIDAAVDEGFQEAERALYERGVKGWDEPVFYEGCESGKVRKFSDRCLIKYLESNSPAKYRNQTSVVVSGDSASPIELRHEVSMVRKELLADDPDFLDHLRSKTLKADSDASVVCENGIAGAVAVGEALGGAGS